MTVNISGQPWRVGQDAFACQINIKVKSSRSQSKIDKLVPVRDAKHDEVKVKAGKPATGRSKPKAERVSLCGLIRTEMMNMT